MEKEEKFQTNKLFLLALKYAESLVTDDEIRKEDITELAFDEFNKVVENGELINITVKGLVTKGKSTVAQEIARRILERYFKRRMSIENICRDQREFIKKLREETTKNTIIVIDEWDSLEETGENSTVIKAQLDQYNKVQAQRFIHRIACSPDQELDSMSDIHLEVIQADKKRKMTHCFVYYRFLNRGNKITQLVGHMDIDVSKTLRSKFYQEYKRRKFQKFELMNREGIIKPRELDYAQMIMEVVEQMKELAKMGLDKQEITESFVREAFIRHKEAHSILGIIQMTKEVRAILNLYAGISKIQKGMRNIEKQEEKGEITPIEAGIKKNIAKKSMESITRSIETLKRELERRIEIKRTYEKEETKENARPFKQEQIQENKTINRQ